MTIRLIVNADDYGRTPHVSTGIREAHLKGIVTSTTAMMNMPGVEDGLRQALRECPNLGMGVHLVLTSGTPLLPLEKVPSLTAAGQATFPGVGEQTARLAELNLDEAAAEWRAQVDRFVAVTGRAPDHLDSHHHFSYFTEGLFRRMLELAARFGCSIRLPSASYTGETNGLPDENYADLLAFAPRLLAEFTPRRPDYFNASFYGETATRETLLEILTGLPDGTTELMCHPGYTDAVLSAGSSYNQQRESELAALTDPAVAACAAEHGIEFASFGTCFPAT